MRGRGTIISQGPKIKSGGAQVPRGLDQVRRECFCTRLTERKVKCRHMVTPPPLDSFSLTSNEESAR